MDKNWLQIVALLEDGGIENVIALNIRKYFDRMLFVACVVKEFYPIRLGVVCIIVKVNFVNIGMYNLV